MKPTEQNGEPSGHRPMIVQRIVSAVVDCVPQNIKIAFRGRRGSPNRLATAVHLLLNRMPAERYPILSCGGVLKGFRMRVDWQIHRSFAYGTWEPDVVRALQAHVTRGMRVLDIGAQTGFYSLLLSRLVGPTGEVIAFEPLPANFRLLVENVRLNRLENVIVRSQAIAQTSGEINFEFPHDEPALVGGPLLEGESQGTFPVQAISLDDFLSESGDPVQFIKMDVEGAETDVLQGARRLLDASHPNMMIELHHMPAHSGYHPAAALVGQLGYHIEWLGEVDSTAHILARWMPSSK